MLTMLPSAPQVHLSDAKGATEKQEKQDGLISNEARSSHAGDYLRGIFGVKYSKRR